MTFDDYFEETFNYMEEIGVPSYVEDFEAEGPAKAINGTIQVCFLLGLSYRKCAIICWSFCAQKTFELWKSKAVN